MVGQPLLTLEASTGVKAERPFSTPKFQRMSGNEYTMYVTISNLDEPLY